MVSKKISGKSAALSVLRSVTKMIATMSDEQLNALATGAAYLKFTPVDASSDRSAQGSLGLAGSVDFDRIILDMRAVETTQAADDIMYSASLTRLELEQLARMLDLPVMRQDSIRRLEEKIIETLVGSRLNSRAVRGR